MNKRRYHPVWIMFVTASILGAVLLIINTVGVVRRDFVYRDDALHMTAPALSACGDAFVFYHKDEAVIIDTGEKDDQDRLLSLLKKTGIERIDAMILTHFDKDHIGGAPAVLNRYPVKKCYMTVGKEDSPEYEALEEALEKAENKYGTRPIRLTDKAEVKCLGASFEIYPPTGLDFRKDADNNVSLITGIRYGKTDLLFAGDAEAERADQFYENQYDGRDYRILKVPHHGRNKKLIKKMMTYFKPEAAIITSSREEPEKKSVVRTLQDQGTEVFLTRDGELTMTLDEDHIEIRQKGTHFKMNTAQERPKTDSAEAGSVVINEIGTEGPGKDSWAELYNTSGKDLSLGGWSLSEHKNDLFRYEFPADTVIKSHDYLLVKFDDSMPFSLAGSEVLCLAGDGLVADDAAMPLWASKEKSFGRKTDGGPETGALTPTPGKTNAKAKELSTVDAPRFSRRSGFYDKEFKLSVSGPKGTRIYYTLDGSDPDENSREYKRAFTVRDVSPEDSVYCMRKDFYPYSYKNGLRNNQEVKENWFCRYFLPFENADKCTVVRAIAVDRNGNRSDTASASYFVGYRNRTGYKDMPVLSLVSDPDGLFGAENGIMVNGKTYENMLSQENASRLNNVNVARKYCNSYAGRGREWERKIHMDYFGSDGRLVFSQEAGMRLHGNSSRVAGPKKSFNLYARKEYDGNDTFLRSFFDTGLLSKSITLMKGDDIRNYYFSKKMWIPEAPTQDYVMAQVFIDGEYWGLYAIQERYTNDVYMKTHYNLGKGDYTMAKGLRYGFIIKDGNPNAIETSYNVLRDYVQNTDLADDKNYDQLCSIMDVDSFIRCYATKIYTGDRDWTNYKNQLLYYSDHKWHWMIYDMDAGAGIRPTTRPDVDVFTRALIDPAHTLATDELFPYLMKNKRFCARFIAFFMDIANDIFSADKVEEEMASFKKKYGEACMKEAKRYPKGDDVTREITAETSRLTDTCDNISWYFSERRGYITAYLEDYFGLQGKQAAVTIRNDSTGKGRIRINSVTPGWDYEKKKAPESWTGSYYTDYPVTLKAIPEEGFHFVRWEREKGKGSFTAQDKEETDLSFTDDITVKAIFEHE